MTTGLLDQRIRIYGYSSVLTDGVPQATYTFEAERWGRMEQPSGSEVTFASQASHRVDVVLVLRAGTTVARDAVLTVGEDVFVAVAVLPNRKLGVQRILASYVDDAANTYTLVDS